jgi:hypothetical protein
MKFLSQIRRNADAFRSAVRFCLATLLLCAFAFGALAQLTPVSIQSGLTNSPSWFTNGYFLLCTNSKPIEVPQGKGLSCYVEYGASTAEFTTGQVCLRFTVSPDGTNYWNDTNKLICLWSTPVGLGPVKAWTNWPAWLLDNCRYIKLYDMTNANSGVTCVVMRITNVSYITH